jgi:hypothetical protein
MIGPKGGITQVLDPAGRHQDGAAGGVGGVLRYQRELAALMVQVKRPGKVAQGIKNRVNLVHVQGSRDHGWEASLKRYNTAWSREKPAAVFTPRRAGPVEGRVVACESPVSVTNG